MEPVNKLEEWSHEEVFSVLQRWEMEEFCEFVKEKQLDGKNLMNVTEGIIKLWKPKADAKKMLLFLKDLKENPDKYVILPSSKKEIVKVSKETNICPESQYQTVTVRKTREEVNVNTVEEILKKIVPAKSFLYRNQQKRTEKAVTSYLPMDAGTTRKKSFFRLSSYEYPFFDIRLRFSKIENNTDRGYYSVKSNRYCIQKSCKKQEVKTKYKSLPSPEPISNNIIEDHFYEDLNYNEMNKINDTKETSPSGQGVQVKPCMVKIQELFQSFKFPFFRKSEEVLPTRKISKEEKDGNIYENNDSVLNMYDSIHVMHDDAKAESKEEKQVSTLPVEEYLEPVQLHQEYCDVRRRHEDSLLGYIMNYFENRFGVRRETNEGTHSEDSETDSKECEDKWSTKKTCNMAARPLPVPVENEPFYMNVDRAEAENLLRGQPDGTFVLRPSSQPNHAYTLSVSCGGAVHNVGVRRRADGRLALGFARRGERSFPTVTSLLRHHRRRRLLLVAAGDVIGATTLADTPHYYQTPSSLPVLHV
ncbi:uncharacterized protein LOC106714000 [Papilio machaon]|uniref:uncharacterized protein LOC106714000 n=1 Tax=Papilio machaon TaxID=76193 RepID=UPI001E6635D7|nr:uncharacterized protein LOC106714000 [Papilio machaon]